MIPMWYNKTMNELSDETLRNCLSALGEETSKPWLTNLDFAVLKTQMLLAAVDGAISPAELAFFRSIAERYRDNVNGMTFETLWQAALHGAGYLLLQSQLLPRDELVQEFVKEAEPDLSREIASWDDAANRSARDALERMARIDGDYSDIERDCIEALVLRLNRVRSIAHLSRFPDPRIMT